MINNLFDFFKAAGANAQQAMGTAAAAMPKPGAETPKPVNVVWGNDTPASVGAPTPAKPGSELRTFGTNLAREASPTALPDPAAQSTTNPTLINKESGGRWDAKNNAVGSGGRKGHFGRIQFGRDRYSEAQAAGVVPADMPIEAFATAENAATQVAAENWHWADIEEDIRRNGYDKLIGQTIRGIPITLEGMKNVAHLGGKGGLHNFIKTGGQYNKADVNGTSLADYLAMGASGEGIGGPQGGSQASGGIGFDPALGRAPTDIASMGNPMGEDQTRSMGAPATAPNPYTIQQMMFDDQPVGTLLQQIQLQMGTPEGIAATSEALADDPTANAIADSLYGPTDSNLSMGTQDASPKEGNVERSAAGAAAASDDPKDQEAAEKLKRDARRERIANVLQVIGVGLGQMSTGQAVDATAVIGQQQQQRQFDATRADEAAAKAYDPGPLARQLAAAGNPQAAALAYQGREGYEAAMQIAQSQFTPSKSADGGVSQGEIDNYVNYLTQTKDYEGAAFVKMGGEAAYKRHVGLYGEEGGEGAGEGTMPDMETRINMADEAVRLGLPEASSKAILSSTDPRFVRKLMGDVADRMSSDTKPGEPGKGARTPAQLKAAANYLRSQDDPAKKKMAEVIEIPGAVSPEYIDKMLLDDLQMANAVEQASQIKANEIEANSAEDIEQGKQVAEGLREIGRGDSREARIYERLGLVEGTKVLEETKAIEKETNERIAAENTGKAMAGMFPEDPKLQFALNNSKNSTDVANALDAARLLKPEIPNEKLLYDYAKVDPAFGGFLMKYKRTAAGAMSPAKELQFKNFESIMTASTETLIADKKIMGGMQQMLDIVTQPGYEGGKAQEAFLLPLQNWSDSLGLGIDFFSEEGAAVGLRAMQALTSANSQFLRAENSGSMSDFDAQNFIKGMPNIGDSTVQAAAIAQAYIATAQGRERNHGYTVDYLSEYGESEDFSSGQHYMDYMNRRAAEDNAPKSPFRDFKSDKEVQEAMASGSITRGTVYRVVGDNGNMVYRMVGRKNKK